MANIKSINGNPIVLDSNGIAANAVTAAKIANNAVSGDKIPDGEIIDRKLSNASGQIRDRVASLESDRIPFPTEEKYGVADQVLRTNGDGSTYWEYEYLPPEEVMDTSIRAWLEENPEATTTVEDDAVTTQKIADGAVTRAKLANDVFDKHMYVHINGSDTGGTLYVIEYNGTFICCDIGQSGDDDNVDEFLASILGDSKLSAVIITHFHSDHCGCPDVVSEYCDENTNVFIQMPPTESNGQYTTYTSAYETIISVFPQAVVPENDSTHTYGGMSVRIFNTDTSNCSLYDSTPANTSAILLNEESGLNNYSLMTEIVTPAGSYLNTGDAEGVAQEMNVSYVKKVDLMRMPHHCSNLNGYYQFFKNANPDLFETTLHANSQATATRRYVGKVMQLLNKCLTINNDSDYTIDIYHHVSSNSPYVFSWMQPTLYNFTGFYSCISATYYSQDPWALFRMTDTELVNVIRTYGIPGNYTLHDDGSDADIVPYFMYPLVRHLLPYVTLSGDEQKITTNNYYINFNIDSSMNIAFQQKHSQSRDDIVEVKVIYTPSLESKYYVHPRFINSSFYFELEGESYNDYPETYTITDTAAINLLRSAKQVYVYAISPTGAAITICTTRAGRYQYHDTSIFQGVAFSPSSTSLTYATISSSKVISASRYFIKSENTDTPHIVGFEIA